MRARGTLLFIFDTYDTGLVIEDSFDNYRTVNPKCIATFFEHTWQCVPYMSTTAVQLITGLTAPYFNKILSYEDYQEYLAIKQHSYEVVLNYFIGKYPEVMQTCQS